jgi:hypothetical protein
LRELDGVPYGPLANKGVIKPIYQALGAEKTRGMGLPVTGQGLTVPWLVKVTVHGMVSVRGRPLYGTTNFRFCAKKFPFL